MLIEFSAEAGDSYNRAIDALRGFTVEVHPEIDGKDGEPFDAEIVGPDHDEGWYGTILVRRFNEDTGCGEGEPWSVIARKVVVY